MFKFKNKTELDLQEKFIEILEQIAAVPKILYVTLAALLILALPGKYLLDMAFSSLLAPSPSALTYQPPQAQDLQILDQKIFESGHGKYYAYARVYNPNSELAVRSLNFAFHMTMASGKTTTPYSGQTYILPAQTRIILMPVKEFSEPPQSLNVSLEVGRWSRPQDIKNLNFIIEQQSYGAEASGQYYTSGIIRNENQFIVSQIDVGIVLYNIKKEVVGANFTTLEMVGPYETRFFRVIWPQGISAEVVLAEITPGVNQLLANALLTEKSVPENFDPIPR